MRYEATVRAESGSIAACARVARARVRACVCAHARARS